MSFDISRLESMQSYYTRGIYKDYGFPEDEDQEEQCEDEN